MFSTAQKATSLFISGIPSPTSGLLLPCWEPPPSTLTPAELASTSTREGSWFSYAIFNKLSKPEMFFYMLQPTAQVQDSTSPELSQDISKWIITTKLYDYLTYCTHNWMKPALSPLFFLLRPISPIIFIYWSQAPFNTSSLPGRAVPAC